MTLALSLALNAGAGAANQRVEAVRRVFPRIWIDSDKCAGGIDAIGWYHEKKDEHRGVGLGPDHDWSSHCCDAFGAMALEAEKLSKAKTKRTAKQRDRVVSGGWLGS